MASELPDFAAQWVQQWKNAAPVLQAIRDEELRQLGENDGAKMLGAGGHRAPESFEANGLAIWQSWMMRLRVIELLNDRE